MNRLASAALLLAILLGPPVSAPLPGRDAGQGAPGEAPAAIPPVPPAEEPPPELAPEDLGMPSVWDIRVPPVLIQDPRAGQAAVLGRFYEEYEEAVPPEAVLRAIVGFVFLLALAYLAGHPRFQGYEQRLKASPVITSGVPFILLGALAALPELGILTPGTLSETRALIPLGLGWIGFRIGFSYSESIARKLPQGAAALSLLAIGAPMTLIAAAVVLFGKLVGDSASGPALLRDALLLGLAGSADGLMLTSYRLDPREEEASAARVGGFVAFELIALLLGLLLVSVYFRPPSAAVRWDIPGTAWLFLTFGLGSTIGIVTAFLFRSIGSGPPFSVVLLGSIAFAAGVASFLRLSSMSVCFIAGVTAAVFAPAGKREVDAVLHRIERPVLYLFLLLAGAMWHYWEWQGWALALVLVAGRLGGKWITFGTRIRASTAGFSAVERRSLTFAPVGGVSIAVLMSTADLFRTPAVAWMVTAVIAGALLTEVIEGLFWRYRPPGDPVSLPSPAPAVPAG
jgi:hypothetical protein